MSCINVYQCEPCQARPKFVDINYNELPFYQFIVIVNEYGESCNIIDDPYARVCVPHKIKDMNVKISHLMSGLNKTRFLV